MRRMRWSGIGLVVLLATAADAVRAQDAAAIIAQGERARAALDAQAALATFERGLAAEARNYELLWRASREAADLGEGASDAARREPLYAKAEQYARRAVAANPAGADGHAMLAIALGRRALALGVRDRVRYAGDVRAACLAALRADPDHAAALHVLGVWHAEILRLNGIARFAARNFLGGRVFDEASWGEAQRLLERAVAVDPQRITHRLDLATIYRDTRQREKARAACAAATQLPSTELHDERYKRECAALVATLGT